MKWRKKEDEEAVSPVIAIILMVAITVVLAGVLYVWVTSLADTEDTVKTLNLQGSIGVDAADTKINVSLEHRGGDPITWNDYQVTVDGNAMSGNPLNGADGSSDSQSTVGETGYWQYTFSGTAFTVGGTYTVKVIHTETANIAWEKKITAKNEDI